MAKKMDLTGQRYGKLTVLREVESKTKDRKWLCKCECGNEKAISMCSLRNGRTKSCGCLQKEKSIAKNSRELTGQKFGRLTVIERTDKRQSKRSTVWLCECECGKKVYVAAANLQDGSTKSCGCLAQERIQSFHKKAPTKNGVHTANFKREYMNKSTGIRGVRKKRNKYQARINIKNKEYNLGTFETIDEATAARQKAEIKYHQPYL